MSIFAFRRGRGPVFPDLPPTLQPSAVLVSAPHPDSLRAALWSALAYALLAGGAMALASLGPPAARLAPQPAAPERIVVFDPPPPSRFIERLRVPPGAARGGALVEGGPPVSAAKGDPDQAPAGLPTEDRHLDRAANGAAGFGPAVRPEGAGAPAATGPVVHDFSTTGLAVLHRVDPLYPDFARRARVQGTVVLMMTVDERGLPVQVQALEGHPALQEAALQAARQWRFEPARMDGRPVAASFRLTLKFSLR